MIPPSPPPSPSDSSSSSHSSPTHSSQSHSGSNSPLNSAHSSIQSSLHSSPNRSNRSSTNSSSPSQRVSPFPIPLRHPLLRPIPLAESSRPSGSRMQRGSFMVFPTRPFIRFPFPVSDPPQEMPSTTTEVFLPPSTPPLSVTSTLSSLSPMSLSPPRSKTPSPYKTKQKSPEPGISTEDETIFLTWRNYRRVNSAPQLNQSSMFAPLQLPYTGMPSQTIVPLPQSELLKKSVSEPNLLDLFLKFSLD